MEAVVYNQSGKKSGSIALPAAVFAAPWNADLVHQVMLAQRANERDAIAHTKGRDEVRGGGKKPWRQKGTGRARHGSSRSPIWVGGGIAHGPRNDKNFSQRIPRRMKGVALATVLSKKLADKEVVFLNDLAIAAKTKEAKDVVVALAGVEGLASLAGKKKNALVIALPKVSVEIRRAFQNMGNITVISTDNLNVLGLLNNRYVAIVSPEESVASLEKRVTMSGRRSAK